ncbi:gephyrin-like molybdotransferase receptor GlpR [Streptomyces sp. CRN 30]|uniref:divisome protein SepX/GlpR n=1 Tax=Streptomyces sp. CRN 30 TaxID=3075613 RepID=UPI002A839D54|nr:gephyrin-like molybdotransferase receptor GlpR [Streptomyces sp. CRN 30]
MSSSGLIYAVIVGAWAAYLVPMWLRRQDELNEARPTERFSTAIRLLSGRAGMERRYAKDLQARSTDEVEHDADPDAVTDSVDVRAFAMPPQRPQTKVYLPVEREAAPPQAAQAAQAAPPPGPVPSQPGPAARTDGEAEGAQAPQASAGRPGKRAGAGVGARKAVVSAEAAARAQRSKVLARRRRTTVMLFLAFTLGSIVAAVGGLAFLWAPGVPAVMLSAYIAYLRAQERRRFTYTMDRRLAEAAAQRLRERQPRRRPAQGPGDADEPEDGSEVETRPDLSALAADRRALVEQTDHAEWVDQQRERQRRPGHGDSWDPVPVPLPTYVTAPVAPRATPNADRSAPDAWSPARSSAAEPGSGHPEAALDASLSAHPPEPSPANPANPAEKGAEDGEGSGDGSGEGRSDARRAASARRARGRGRTPLFDQYEDGDRPRAANE